jgi:hypothetical protein
MFAAYHSLTIGVEEVMGDHDNGSLVNGMRRIGIGKATPPLHLHLQ